MPPSPPTYPRPSFSRAAIRGAIVNEQFSLPSLLSSAPFVSHARKLFPLPSRVVSCTTPTDPGTASWQGLQRRKICSRGEKVNPLLIRLEIPFPSRPLVPAFPVGQAKGEKERRRKEGDNPPPPIQLLDDPSPLPFLYNRAPNNKNGGAVAIRSCCRKRLEFQAFIFLSLSSYLLLSLSPPPPQPARSSRNQKLGDRQRQGGVRVRVDGTQTDGRSVPPTKGERGKALSPLRSFPRSLPNADIHFLPFPSLPHPFLPTQTSLQINVLRRRLRRRSSRRHRSLLLRRRYVGFKGWEWGWQERKKMLPCTR